MTPMLLLCSVVLSMTGALPLPPPFSVPLIYNAMGSDLRPIYIQEMEGIDNALMTATPLGEAGVDPKERRCLWAESGMAFARGILLTQFRPASRETLMYRDATDAAFVEFGRHAREACLGLSPKRYARARQLALLEATKWHDTLSATGLLRATVGDALLRAGRCGALPGSCGMSRASPEVARAIFYASLLAISGAVTLEAGELALPFAWPLPVAP